MELMQDSIYSIISKKQGFTENVISYICEEVIKGTEFLHSLGRVHRDIKTENILFNSNGDIKISDFGFSAQLTAETDKRTTIVGTPSYMAPEIIDGDGYDDKVDIWSIGIIAYELAEGRVPVEGSNHIEVLTLTYNSPSPLLSDKHLWSPAFHDFLSSCFEKRPGCRLSSRQLLSHAFLSSRSKQEFLSLINS